MTDYGCLPFPERSRRAVPRAKPRGGSRAEPRDGYFFSIECLQDWCVLHTLVSTNYPNRILTGSFDNRFATVNTPKDNTPQPEEVNDLKAQVEMLQAEKLKLEAELKSREEMMSNLLSFIQASK